MHKTAIPHAIAQEVLDSATNAAEKGLSQFLTPAPLAAHLVQSLPKHRLTICDLNAGRGDLVRAAANATTTTLLGSDIDPAGFARVPGGDRHTTSFIPYDLTLLHPLLAEVDWRADLFVLNPPWRLFWHRTRLAGLAEARLVSVRQAFAGIEDRAPKGTIDSTVATLLLALDRCTTYGEGLLIANHATLERLIFAPGAPHAALAQHAWARVIIPGNPMTKLAACKWEVEEGREFHTEALYFALEHDQGPQSVIRWDEPWRANATLTTHPLPDRVRRLGLALRNPASSAFDTLPRWLVVRDRVKELQGAKPRTPWNLWLDDTGVIRTALSSFEQHSRKLDKAEAARLHELNGQHPMKLVLLRNTRDELFRIAESSGWRVQPALLAGIREAVRQYHAARAPLYPLSDIQRLGYCDEQDWLECKANLLSAPATGKPRLIFAAGQRYPLRTQTVAVTRQSTRANSHTGAPEAIERSGLELAIFLHSRVWTPPVAGQKPPDDGHREFAFLDRRLVEDETTRLAEDNERGRSLRLPNGAPDFTLDQLVEHFIIPDAPDVATTNPAGYAANLAALEQLEQTLAQLAA